MKQEKNNKGIVTLLVVIIVILITLMILLATGTMSIEFNKPNNNKESTNQNDNNIIEDNKVNENDTETNINDNIIDNNENKESENQTNQNEQKYTIKAKTSEEVYLLWNPTKSNIEIVDGNLKIDNNTFSIPNEKIKYFYLNMYQCGGTIVFYYLTESGNVYVTEANILNPNIPIETLIEFTKLDFLNVTDIVVIPNDNYGKPLDEKSGIIDNVPEYLYALINGETYKLDHQYRCI